MSLLKKWWFWLLLFLLLIVIWSSIGFFKCGGKANLFTSTIGVCKFECSSGWINCMPALSFSEAKYCAWVRKNCPSPLIAE